jgi:hypothetical protein
LPKPTYQTNKDVTWTYDWQADQQRGLEIGSYYEKIGILIDDHYRALYDPTTTTTTSSSVVVGVDDIPLPNVHIQGGDGHRTLTSRRTKGTTGGVDPVPPAEVQTSSLSTLTDPSSTGVQQQHAQDVYDWKIDKDRGIAIGEYYHQLGDAVADHYNQTSPYKDSKGNDVNFEWTSFWDEYRQKGQYIGQYYKNKAQAIKEFYDPPTDTVVIPNTKASKKTIIPPSTVAPTTTRTSYDWQAQKAKGLAIADYYRARYDPTYGTDSKPQAADTTTVPLPGGGPPPRPPLPPPSSSGGPPPDFSLGIAECEQTFPPWGQDKEADKGT